MEITNSPPKSCEITELPPPVNGDRASVNSDGKLKALGESNGVGGDLPRAVMAADRAPKAMSFPAVVDGQNGGFRRRGWSKMKAGDVRSITQAMMRPNFDEIDGGGGGLSRSSFELNRGRSCWFSAARMAGKRRLASKLQIDTLIGW